MRKQKKVMIFIVIVLATFMITIFPRFQGVDYTLKSGNVIDYLNFTVDSDFIWISLERGSIWSNRTELSNEEFKESYNVLTNLEYKLIEEHKNIDLANNENEKYTLGLSDGIRKYKLMIVEKGIIIVDPFTDDEVTFTKLFVTEDELNKFLEELSRCMY